MTKVVLTFKIEQMITKAINWIKARMPLFCKGAVSFSLWEYGTCNNIPARRHKVNKNVQFVIFKKGDQKYVDGIGLGEGGVSRLYRFKHPQKLIEKLMFNICTSPLLLPIPCYRQ